MVFFAVFFLDVKHINASRPPFMQVFVLFVRFPFLLFVSDGKRQKKIMQKQMIWNSKRHAEHPFAGQNSQQSVHRASRNNFSKFQNFCLKFDVARAFVCCLLNCVNEFFNNVHLFLICQIVTVTHTHTLPTKISNLSKRFLNVKSVVSSN